MKTLIRGGTVVTMSERLGVIPEGFVLINGRQIEAVGSCADLANAFTGGPTIHLEHEIIIPGLINLHNHPAASLLKATAPGMFLEEWIAKVAIPMNQHLDCEMLSVASRFQAAEMLRSGTTTCLLHLVNCNDAASFEATFSAATQLGLRQVVAKEIRDAPKHPLSPGRPTPSYPRSLGAEMELADHLIRVWHNTANGMVRVALAIEAGATWLLANATSTESILAGMRLAERHDILISCHVSATPQRAYAEFLQVAGKGEIAYLRDLGALSDRWVFVHSLNIQPQEVEWLAQAGCRVCHCPVSNAYSADGVADLPLFRTHGIACGLGTDGAYVCGTTDLFEVMKFCSLTHNVRALDPSVVKPSDVLRLATIEGARVLGLSDELGSLEPGKLADLVILEMFKLGSWPVVDLFGSIVHATRGNNVQHVFVNGEKVVCDGRLTRCDEVVVLREASNASRELLRCSGLESLRQPR